MTDEALASVLDGLGEVASGFTLAKLLTAALLLVAGVVLLRLVLWLADRTMRLLDFEKGLRRFLRTMLKVLLWCLVLMVAGSALGFDPSSLVTLVGVFALAFSLAVQGSLSNLAGGVTLMATKPFVVGDFIEISGTVGLVKEVGLVHTVLDTADNKVVFVPNSQVSSSKVVNYSRNAERRLDLSFRASAEEDPQRVRSVILAAVDQVADVLKEPPPYVGVGNFSEKGTEYILRVWVNNQSYRTVTFDLQEAVRAAFVEQEVKLAVQMVL